MPITQERVLSLISSYEDLLLRANALIQQVNLLLLYPSETTLTDIAVLMADPLVAHADVTVEKMWFARVGKANARAAEKRRRRKGREPVGTAPKKGTWALTGDPSAPGHHEVDEGPEVMI